MPDGPVLVEIIPPDALAELITQMGDLDPELVIGQAFSEFAPVFQADLQQNSGNSGRFASSWEAAPAGGAELAIRNTFQKAAYVEFPTVPHIIRPVFAKALAFRPAAGGGIVFAKWVVHPGFAGRNVFSRTLEEDQDILFTMIGLAIERALPAGSVV